jgi:type III secretion system FlhB-like substrate exporter
MGIDGVHKAVALKYSEDLPAPIILAKGKGELAERLKSIAEQFGIELVGMPELTEALMMFEPGTLIPEKYYQIVAELLVYVRGLHDTQKQTGVEKVK